MCVSVCIYVCVYARVCVCVCVCVYICIYMYIYLLSYATSRLSCSSPTTELAFLTSLLSLLLSPSSYVLIMTLLTSGLQVGHRLTSDVCWVASRPASRPVRRTGGIPGRRSFWTGRRSLSPSTRLKNVKPSGSRCSRRSETL